MHRCGYPGEKRVVQAGSIVGMDTGRREYCRVAFREHQGLVDGLVVVSADKHCVDTSFDGSAYHRLGLVAKLAVLEVAMRIEERRSHQTGSISSFL